MRSARLGSFILLIVFILSISLGITTGNTEEHQDFLLRDFKSGENKSFSDILTTKANIMVITETSCYSCIKEIKSMEWLRAKYGEDLSVTIVFIDRQGSGRVKKYLEFYKFDLDMFLIDAGGVIPDRFQASYIPTLIMFDINGKEQYRKQGFIEGEQSLISSKVAELLNKRILKARKKSRTTTASKKAAITGTTSPPKTSGCASTG